MVVLTHAHADAAGGMARLRTWWQAHGAPEPLTVIAHPGAAEGVRRRHRRLDHVEFIEHTPGRPLRWAGWELRSVEVPHAMGDRFPTCAWRLAGDGSAVVYASDVGKLTPGLRDLASGACLLVLDGAMWCRRLFAHLSIDRELPTACEWDVERILLTQIGRTAPPHPDLVRAVRALCERAAPAYDGLVVELA